MLGLRRLVEKTVTFLKICRLTRNRSNIEIEVRSGSVTCDMEGQTQVTLVGTKISWMS